MGDSYTWKCGCTTDGDGAFQSCGIAHDNFITEELNREQEKDEKN